MEYKHFSHPHNLMIYYIQQGDEHTCSGCESFISSGSSAYGCLQCKYFLHELCGNAARGVQHPSHAVHHLTLVSTATYSAGTFFCNACGDGGTSFSYCCPLCDFDLHVQCASLPQFLKHNSHLHNLYLTYDVKSFNEFDSNNVCGICHKVLDNRYWAYNCFACNFQVHTACVSGEKKSVKTHHVDKNVLEPEAQLNHKKDNADSGSGSGSNQGQADQAEAQIEDPILKAQIEMQNLQLQMQMANELSKMMSSFNLSSFV